MNEIPASERQLLQNEITSLRAELEKSERELDKAKAQRDQFKAGLEICSTDREHQLEAELEKAREDLAKGGPLHAERWTLKDLLAELEKVKAIASDRTCVSFENLCWGALSLWHQTHRENFRKIDRKPEELSRFIMDNCRSVHNDFPNQVLDLLKNWREQLTQAQQELAKAKKDSRRLDDLQSAILQQNSEFQFHELGVGPRVDEITFTFYDGHTTRSHTAKTLREVIDKVIDAAMQPSQSGEQP